MRLVRLKTQNMVNPKGIDTAPYFSWVIESDQQQVMQKEYRLKVYSDSHVYWDTGIVESDQSTFVAYAGEALNSREEYTWTVEVFDSCGETASASALFETAFLNKSEWKAKWVMSPLPMGKYKSGFGKQAPAALFRKSFSLTDQVKSARLYATCHGAYLLSVNGRHPDDRILAPEHTVYGKYLCYQTYDVTESLKKGNNAIGMHVGDGWYNCPGFRPDMRGFKPHRAILFQLEVEYQNGDCETIVSDASVKTNYGPVRFSDLFAGECYDANFEQNGWDQAKFDDSGWTNVVVKPFGYENLVAQYGQPIRPIQQLSAQKMWTSPKGETILDFGQVLAGWVRIHADLPKGAEIRLDHFETPDKEGNYFNNIMSVSGMGGREQRVVYVSNGSETEYEPLFTFQGFRYVRVICESSVKPEDFTAVVISSEKEDLGTFECSDARLNRLYENTRWSQRSNMISIPTDCPQREKAGWTGDIQIYTKTALLNEDVTPFLTRWLQNVICDQAKNGAVPIVVPCNGFYPGMSKAVGLLFGNKGSVGVAGWGDAATIVPWDMYQITGNKEILRSQYESMKKWCDYVITTARTRRGKNNLPNELDQYLWNTGFHFGEWLVPSLSKNGIGKDVVKAMKSTLKYTAPIFGWYSVHIMAETAALLGVNQDTAYFREIAAKMKHAIMNGLIDKDGNMPTELMGAYVLPSYFDLVPDQYKEHFKSKLLSLLDQNDGCLDTGFLATPFLLDTFCKIGRTDLAYSLLFQEKCPSWLYEVKQGATSIWESYYTYLEDGTPLATSHNHYAFGCVDDWMFRHICGIESIGAGFQRIRIQPDLDGSLTYAKRTYLSEYGTIGSIWERKGKVFQLNVQIPCNTSAEIIMPDGQLHEVGSGIYQFECEL